ncbi:hypothetical protein [Buttiauxella sp. S04-F03]|uniref:hypothetical protein n=1 Tax=Buttiauxella sp. S04-F03 TaxID=2904525 RepID=UPI001E57C2AC|nr:hypothetical protein [Buttiauxella sp. S04-F03]MCE0813137.1 hypothetical protein [Buttiauxella sp. S04-F03]
MNWDVLKWLIGIYFGCFFGLLKVAYSDPKFYLEYIDKKLTWFCYTCMIAFSAFWYGLYACKSYTIDNIDLISEQLAHLDKEYNYVTSYLLVLIITSCLSFAASILYIDVARRKQAHLSS